MFSHYVIRIVLEAEAFAKEQIVFLNVIWRIIVYKVIISQIKVLRDLFRQQLVVIIQFIKITTVRDKANCEESLHYDIALLPTYILDWQQKNRNKDWKLLSRGLVVRVIMCWCEALTYMKLDVLLESI